MKELKTEDEWKKKLTKEQYKVLREKETEKPFTGKLLYNKKKGKYVCAACGNVIFDSSTKFDSECGWPSFYDAKKDSVRIKVDLSHGMIRREVLCSKCGSHLGHIFNDAPQTPTGKRFCINSIALNFKKDGKNK
jgi:peptide-methionine (R)-S-oxide reductase